MNRKLRVVGGILLFIGFLGQTIMTIALQVVLSRLQDRVTHLEQILRPHLNSSRSQSDSPNSIPINGK